MVHERLILKLLDVEGPGSTFPSSNEGFLMLIRVIESLPQNPNERRCFG